MQQKNFYIPRIAGMTRDTDVSLATNEGNCYAYENMNIRITPISGETQFAFSNELGTLELSHLDADDIPIGTCVMLDRLVIFTHNTQSKKDKIWVYSSNSNSSIPYNIIKLYEGNLNFDEKNPIETLASYESEFIQKVYWVDGINQPRVINIAENNLRKDSTWLSSRTANYFDFTRKLPKYLPEVIITRRENGGYFGGEAVQYVFTFVTKYAQETAIWHQSAVYYTGYNHRGCSPEESCNNSFLIGMGCTIPVDEELDWEQTIKEFDFIRVYSIRRSSKNAQPIVRLVEDIDCNFVRRGNNEETVTYSLDSALKDKSVDDGVKGHIIPTTDLLYKNGNRIIPSTMCQKDGTLFLGGLKEINDIDISGFYIRYINQPAGTSVNYNLNLLNKSKYNQPVFMPECEYEIGVQIMDEYGRWSDVIDKDENGNPVKLKLGSLQYKIGVGYKENNKYVLGRYFRILYKQQDSNTRNILGQAVIQPTVSIIAENQSPKYQSSYFFRHVNTTDQLSPRWAVGYSSSENTWTYKNFGAETCWNGESGYSESYVPIVTRNDLISLHSPEIEFNSELQLLDYSNVTMQQIGYLTYAGAQSDFRMTLKGTPSDINKPGPLNTKLNKRLCAGLLYDDQFVGFLEKKGFIADRYKVSASGDIEAPKAAGHMQFMIYPWHHTGCLNNYTGVDLEGVLQHKQLTNFLKYDTVYFTSVKNAYSLRQFMRFIPSTQGASYELNSIMGDSVTTTTLYQGCVNQTLMRKVEYPSAVMNMAFSPRQKSDLETVVPNSLDNVSQYTSEGKDYVPQSNHLLIGTSLDTLRALGIEYQSGYQYNSDVRWKNWYSDIQLYQTINDVKEFSGTALNIAVSKKAISMKYNCPAHIIAYFQSGSFYSPVQTPIDQDQVPVVNIIQTGNISNNNLFIPASKIVKLSANSYAVPEWGDAWFKDYECIKSYPASYTDENQILEVATFPLFSYVNIDGRYDVNAESRFNIASLPSNTNLINPVYSQLNNFFQYEPQDPNYIKINSYPNTVIINQNKQLMASHDEWTHITLGATLDLDGDKGPINKLQRFGDSVICFQNTGICRILFNENTAISTTNGVPIELGNSGKLQGKQYLSNNIGTTNKWSVLETEGSLYFVDSITNAIYRFSDQGLVNISKIKGFDYFISQYITDNTSWYPNKQNVYRSLYDKVNKDVYFVNKDHCLCWNEDLQEFTSFFNYENSSFMDTVKDQTIILNYSNTLWQMHADHYLSGKGSIPRYNTFFGKVKPFYTTLIINPNPSQDRMFTNVELNSDVTDRAILPLAGTMTEDRPLQEYLSNTDWNDATYELYNAPIMPFTHFRMYNEYQDTERVELTRIGKLDRHSKSNIKQKFRTWRIDVPRNVVSDGKTNKYQRDRIRNPWVFMTLYNKCFESFKVNYYNETTQESETKLIDNTKHIILHNLNVVYYE